MARLFGTDGVRGLANVELTPELRHGRRRRRVSRSLSEGHRPTVVVGRDTARRPASCSRPRSPPGLASAGADVIQLGVRADPGGRAPVAASGADLGVVLSASHNPMPDNGIKIFGRGGFKLADDVEDSIEALRRGTAVGRARPAPTSAGCVGRSRPGRDGRGVRPPPAQRR